MATNGETLDDRNEERGTKPAELDHDHHGKRRVVPWPRAVDPPLGEL
jgi:hypothetical protein